MLEQIFHELNQAHFGSELPLPELRWNSRLASTAGRFCPGSRLLLRPRRAQIEVATYLRDLPDGAMHVRDTVLHEMVHFYLWYKQRPHGHTAEFHRILQRVGGKRYNTVPKERAFLHWYECPNCKQGFHTRRRLGVSACAKCCERFNQGRFHDRFRLVRLAPRAEAEDKKPLPAGPRAGGPAPAAPAQRLTPSEIIRRLEDLKNLVRTRS